MSVLNVTIKHTGKTYPVQLDTSAPGLAFKQKVYELTGVPVERMKVMVKGGVLKDDANWATLGPKEGQTIMVVGAAGELPKPPAQPVVFLEDLGDDELAKAEHVPVGFKNLGNTCYMNSTLQTMRAIPELQTALQSYRPTGSDASVPSARLTTNLRDLYANMERTTDGYTPHAFLSVLRELVPQFAEMDRSGSGAGPLAMLQRGYAQQDAEECWTQIVQHLGVLPGDGPSSKFVQQYMMGEIRKELRCNEAPDEPSSVSVDQFKTIGCNITVNTNFMQQGITEALTEVIEKHSPTLNRTAEYTQTARITRLPKNLVVHMVRFAWRRDIGKKTKIMRRVKFPHELDASEWCSDELRAKLRPVAEKLKEVERERRERAKVRRRTKSALGDGKGKGKETGGDVAMADEPASSSSNAEPEAEAVAETQAGGDLFPEAEYRSREREALGALVHADLKTDSGASLSGLYELAGIVTHKGASADSGHYIGFVRRDAFEDARAEEREATGEVDDSWYKFDDDKVSVITQDKIVQLEGGGEDSVAYILLYRSKKF